MKIALVKGNLTRDPETTTLPSGDSVTNFSVAVNDVYIDKQGNKVESTDYIDCKAYGKTADNIAKFFNKGRPIIIEGELRQEKWVDKLDGGNRSKLIVVANKFHFADSNNNSNNNSQTNRTEYSDDDLGDVLQSTEGLSV